MLMGEPEVFSDTGEGDYFLPNLNGSFEFAENQMFQDPLTVRRMVRCQKTLQIPPLFLVNVMVRQMVRHFVQSVW